MDNWQKQLFDKCSVFIDSRSCHDLSNSDTISLNVKEAYIVKKALEDQERHLYPIRTCTSDP